MENLILKFIYNGCEVTMQCKRDEYMKDIFKKYITKTDLNPEDIYFLYGGDIINEESKVQKFIKDDNEIKILVYEFEGIDNIKDLLKDSKDIICPNCQEICFIHFNDYKITLGDCIKGHCFTNLLLEQFTDFQKINESKIVCNKCNTNKSKTTNNKFYICCNCNINLCPLCKLGHKDHKLLDYDNKNYYCNKHSEKYEMYSEERKENLCKLCEPQSKNNNIQFNNNLINNDNNLEKLRKKIDNLKSEVKKIVTELNKIINNFEKYYNIANKIII